MHYWVILNWAATALSVAAKAGMLLQIRVNYRAHDTGTASAGWFFLNFASYATSGAAGIPHLNPPLLIGQGLGVLPSAVLAWQILDYTLLPRLGFRMNESGHFTGRRTCSACLPFDRDAETFTLPTWVWPQPCPYDRHHGLLHATVWPRDGILSIQCDRCNNHAQHVLPRNSGTPLAGRCLGGQQCDMSAPWSREIGAGGGN